MKNLIINHWQLLVTIVACLNCFLAGVGYQAEIEWARTRRDRVATYISTFFNLLFGTLIVTLALVYEGIKALWNTKLFAPIAQEFGFYGVWIQFHVFGKFTNLNKEAVEAFKEHWIPRLEKEGRLRELKLTKKIIASQKNISAE